LFNFSLIYFLNSVRGTTNQGLTVNRVKSFAQSYPQPTQNPAKAKFPKNIKLLAIPVHPEAHFISAKVLILCTPSYCLPVGPFGPS
jgi:hypothetical protein